jgi:guanylate kinase
MIQKIFLISGSAGAGKDSVLKILKRKDNFYFVTTTTTRKPRKGESQGNPYYFISKNDFLKTIEEDGFLEYKNVYSDYYFGVTKKEIEKAFQSNKNIIWQIDYRGFKKIVKIFPQQTISIFILPPSLKIAKQRLEKRKGDSQKIIKERLALAKKEIKASKKYNYIVVNKEGKLKETLTKILDIINKESSQN